VLAFALAALALLAWNASVPGLHADEAWTILMAHAIAGGERPGVGMTGYSGILLPYLAAPVLAATQWSAQALRGLAAVYNLAALGFALAVLRRTENTPAARAWALLLIASSPTFVVQSRFAVEFNALTPLLSAAALWLLLRPTSGEPPRAARLALAGACFGLAGYNHAMSLALPISLAVLALILDRATWLRRRTLVPLGAGFLVGFAPRIVTMLFSVPLQIASSGSRRADLLDLPWAFFRSVDGSLLYRLITGTLEVYVIPYALLALAALLLLRYRARRPLSSRDAAIPVLIVLLALGITLLGPALSSRHLLLPALLFPMLLVRIAAPLFEGRDARAAHAVLATVLVLNLTYLVLDYFAAFRASGGGLAELRVSTRRVELSHDWVDTRLLYRQLVDRGVEDVICERFIGWPLAVHDLGHSRLRIFLLELEPPALRGRRSALVAYAAPTPRENFTLDVTYDEQIGAHGGPLPRDRGFDGHFAVFVSR